MTPQEVTMADLLMTHTQSYLTSLNVSTCTTTWWSLPLSYVDVYSKPLLLCTFVELYQVFIQNFELGGGGGVGGTG